jgi:hypothetical protein
MTPVSPSDPEEALIYCSQHVISCKPPVAASQAAKIWIPLSPRCHRKGHPNEARALRSRHQRPQANRRCKQYIVQDTVLPKFGVRAMGSGFRSHVLVTGFPGSRNPTPRSLGSCAEIKSKQAREKARPWLAA